MIYHNCVLTHYKKVLQTYFFLVLLGCQGVGMQDPTIQIQLALPQSLVKKQNDIQSDFAKITKLRLSISTTPDPSHHRFGIHHKTRNLFRCRWNQPKIVTYFRHLLYH